MVLLCVCSCRCTIPAWICFRRLVLDDQWLWLGPSWACLWFYWVLTSYCNWALCFFFRYSACNYMCFTVIFRWWLIRYRTSLWTKHIFVTLLCIWRCAISKVMFHASKTGLRVPPLSLPITSFYWPFQVRLLQVFFVRLSEVTFVTLVLSLFFIVAFFWISSLNYIFLIWVSYILILMTVKRNLILR